MHHRITNIYSREDNIIGNNMNFIFKNKSNIQWHFFKKILDKKKARTEDNKNIIQFSDQNFYFSFQAQIF